MSDTKELQIKEKQELTSSAEQTKPGFIFTPAVDIFETDLDLTLLADLPGFKKEDLNIDLNKNILTITGDIAPFEGPHEEDIFFEYEIGRYFRQFSLSEIIDQEKIDAKLKDRVLRLTLPKMKKAPPRKIMVKAE